jgi:hypothetical protein
MDSSDNNIYVAYTFIAQGIVAVNEIRVTNRLKRVKVEIRAYFGIAACVFCVKKTVRRFCSRKRVGIVEEFLRPKFPPPVPGLHFFTALTCARENSDGADCL